MVERVAPSDELAAVKAELALYRDAVESMHQGVCMYDAEGRITVVNRRYAEQFGWGPIDDEAGQSLEGLLDRLVVIAALRIDRDAT